MSLRFFLIHLIYIFSLLLFPVISHAQQDVRNIVLEIRALPFFKFNTDASDIMQKVIENKSLNDFSSAPFHAYDEYEKTTVDLTANKYALKQQLDLQKEKNDFFYKKIINPFEPYLEYARPHSKNMNDLALTLIIYEDAQRIYRDNLHSKKGSLTYASRNEGLFESIGKQNIIHMLNEAFGDIDLYHDQSELMMLSFKSPLANDALKKYTFYYAGTEKIENEDCLSIAFFSKDMNENAFSGYLYISTDGKYSLVKAIFSLNNPGLMNFLKEVLIVHTYSKHEGISFRTPAQKETYFVIGDRIKGNITAERTLVYNHFDFSEPADDDVWKNINAPNFNTKDSLYWLSARPVPLSQAEEQVAGLVKNITLNPVYTSVQTILLTLLNDHITVGGANGKFELGPLTQFISYNTMEGLRLRLGGNTTLNLTDRWLLGGYIAYGTGDKEFKYRGDLIYSFLPRSKYIWEYPKRLLSFTYVNDLNIPGEDLLNTNRDNFIYSFSHASTNNMSLQKIGQLTFETENKHNLAFKIGGKYTYDNPRGVVDYIQVDNGDSTVINHISTSEALLSLSFSPGESFFQNRDKRVPLKHGIVELKLNHRIGFKGIFGSDYNYQITDMSAYKRFDLWRNSGTLDLRFTAGKVWNRVPFPLLFIPLGNQSYIYKQEDYNCMNFYEFITDRFIAGNAGFLFNWSPFRLIRKTNKIKTSVGARVIYGPLSDNNNPALHPELFILNQGIKPLGNTPYAEVNIGFANIFKVLRIEYARRLTYLDNDNTGGHKLIKGSLLFTGSFSF